MRLLSAAVDWLHDALHGRRQLWLATPDEPPDVAILRMDCDRDLLADACVELAEELAGAPHVDEGALRALAGLAVGLGIGERVSPPIVAMASAPLFASRPIEIQVAALSAIVDLGVPQSEEFWRGHHARDPRLALPSLAGIIEVSPGLGIRFAGEIDASDAIVSDGIATLLEQAQERIAVDLRPGIPGRTMTA